MEVSRPSTSAIGRVVRGCALVLLVAPAAEGEASAPAPAKGGVCVLDPVAVVSAAEAVFPPAPRLRALAGREVWVVVVDNGSTLMPAVAALLPEHAPQVRVRTISTSETGNPFFMLKEADRPDAVIAGTGVCESTTVDAVSYARQAEKLGIPAVVSFLGRVYYAQKQATDKLQLFGVRAFATEQPDSDRPGDAERLARRLVPRFVEGLTVPVGRDRPRIGFEGPEAEARARFESLGWDGGQRVVLPTDERVAALLGGTSHRPDEVIGIMGGVREATVEKVAVNAAMAGLGPERMPLALAMAAMMCRAGLAEELGQREPPALQVGVSGGAVAGGAVGPPDDDGIARLARLILVNLAGIPAAILKGDDLRVKRLGPAGGDEGTVSLLDAERAAVWKESTTAVDAWR